MRLIVRSLMVGAAFAAAQVAFVQVSRAQVPALSPPDTVTLDKLGYMMSFPPVGDQIVDNSNRTKYPQLRWVLQHTREVVPTRRQ